MRLILLTSFQPSHYFFLFLFSCSGLSCVFPRKKCLDSHQVPKQAASRTTLVLSKVFLPCHIFKSPSNLDR